MNIERIKPAGPALRIELTYEEVLQLHDFLRKLPWSKEQSALMSHLYTYLNNFV